MGLGLTRHRFLSIKSLFALFFFIAKREENENWIVSIFRQIKKLFRLERKHLKNSLSHMKVEQLLKIYKRKRRAGTWETYFEVAVNLSLLQPCLICACFKTPSDASRSLLLHPRSTGPFKGNHPGVCLVIPQAQLCILQPKHSAKA